MYESIKAGKIVFEETLDTLSDGTAGGVEENSVTFECCQKYVDDWVLVNEEQIQKAVYFMLEHHHKVTVTSHYKRTILIIRVKSRSTFHQEICKVVHILQLCPFLL